MERRESERIDVHAKGTFMVKRGNDLVTEFVADIVDISEGGIRIEIADTEREKIQLITEECVVSFQAMEEYELYGNNRYQYFFGDMVIVRKIQNGDSIVLGCKMPFLPDITRKYIDDRKVSIYINSLKKVINKIY